MCPTLLRSSKNPWRFGTGSGGPFAVRSVERSLAIQVEEENPKFTGSRT